MERLVQKLSLLVALTLTLLMAPGTASAQEATSGSIEGTVTDTAGTPLMGVTVTLSSAQGTKT